MAVFTIQQNGGALKVSKNGVILSTRINLFELQIEIRNNTLLFLPEGTRIDFNVDTVTGFANAEAVADEVGSFIFNANTGV